MPCGPYGRPPRWARPWTTSTSRSKPSGDPPVENRTGVDPGEVVAGDLAAGQRLVTGDTVNTAAPAGAGCASLRRTDRWVHLPIGPSRGRGCDRGGASELKARPSGSLPIGSFESSATKRSPGGAIHRSWAGRRSSTFSKRPSLRHILRRAVPDRAAGAFGPAGVGKSRLLAESLRRCEDRAITLKGRCLPYGSGITYFAIAETIREAAGISEVEGSGRAQKLWGLLGDEGGPVAERLEGAVGLTNATFAVTEIIWAVRRFLEILSARRRVVVLIDDIHWAEPTLLELLQQVTETTSGPVLFCARPVPTSWRSAPESGENGPRARALALKPLSEEESERVIERALGDVALDHRVAARIVGTSGGDPLFVEQMLSMLIDDDVWALEGGRWRPTEPVETIEMPPTISALLSSRLDRLGSPIGRRSSARR